MNTYAIGDIHGEVFKLKLLLKRMSPNKEDTIVFLGDYIDRGMYSYETIEFLIEYSNEYNCIFIGGNHEDMFLHYLHGEENSIFIANGGEKTIRSYVANGYYIHEYLPVKERMDYMPTEHIGFLHNLRYYHETEDYIFVHAGINPSRSMEEQSREDLIWDRDFHYRHTAYKGKTVVFGHTPSEVIMNEPNRICIDTGCGHRKGKLTSVKLPDRVFTSV